MKNELVYQQIEKQGLAKPDIEVPHPITYSQDLEDRMIGAFFSARFRQLFQKDLTYCDIGSNHPIATNNTYYFYKLGAHGVLVEPNPVFADMTQQTRPKDTLVRAAISPSVKPGETQIMQLTVPEHNELASLNAEFVGEWYRRFKRQEGVVDQARQIDVDTLNINDLLQDNVDLEKPCILDIDVEGIDYELFQSLNTAVMSNIQVIIIELSAFIHGGKAFEEKVFTEFYARGYTLYAKTRINHIFVKSATLVQVD